MGYKKTPENPESSLNELVGVLKISNIVSLMMAGESLSGIAKKCNVTQKALIDLMEEPSNRQYIEELKGLVRKNTEERIALTASSAYDKMLAFSNSADTATAFRAAKYILDFALETSEKVEIFDRSVDQSLDKANQLKSNQEKIFYRRLLKTHPEKAEEFLKEKTRVERDG